MTATSRAPRWLITSATILVGLLGSSMVVARNVAMTRVPAVVGSHVVYTPMELRRDLAHTLAPWRDRVVWVRARPVQTFAWTCQHDHLCLVRQPSLADARVDAAEAHLPLMRPIENPLLVRVRQAPLLGRLIARLAPEPRLAWGQVGLYRIRLVVPPSCADTSCVEAQVLTSA